ncbi:organoarsenical effux MFS transporter ArsJ [Sansalvadorimonas verongulae]|uniref:organoarsenical effux MFS transporter ArsJ n=1 Tax=Sansalvadorimonas verongulae TaxID=2172824 RepID=UPI0012BC576A|nr:organoarsenical effux MFS transporter ArsJ [Sansalvadorimonas verongulae]MTI12163.1 organoarsenical effux MFS transporter ArsJ [Sansalvadorimonas verongulae]
MNKHNKILFPLSGLDRSVRQYLLITFNYWNFTITDGALRMLVVLHFHQLGYTPLEVAALFLFYEFFGVVTNLTGGWLGARLGLNRTMNIGLGMQIVALGMLTAPASLLSVPWVMAAQALSGIAKDLNKMSAKSSIKMLVKDGGQGKLYQWIAVLTGSKNALKGLGFFVGGLLLALVGFQFAMVIMALVLAAVLTLSLGMLDQDIGKAKAKAKFTEIFSKSGPINILSAARMFLFGARDIWFVIALPIYLGSTFGWSSEQVGGFLALWVIGYGFVQGIAPKITGQNSDGRSAMIWAAGLAVITAVVAYGVQSGWNPQFVIVAGLLLFGAVFAINSSLHSYLIVAYAREDGVSMDVGFYYMANAMGRLIGTVLSGWLFQMSGLVFCLWVSAGFVAAAALISVKLPQQKASTEQ